MMTSDQHPLSVQSANCQLPVYVISTDTTSGRRENFAAKKGMALGKAQVVLGSLIFILNIVYMVYDWHFGPIFLGMICAVLTITAGGLGIGAAKKKTTWLIVGFMVLSIVAGIAAGLLTLYAFLPLSLSTYTFRGYEVYLVLHILTFIAALVVTVCGFWASYLGCKVTCCCTQPPETFQAVHQDETAAPVVMIQATTVPTTNQVNDDPPPEYTQGMDATVPSTNTEGG